MTITLGSLFDGIGVFPLAASRHGIMPLWASEIVPDAISITKRHFPAMVHLGDITKLDGGKIPAVHVITFGFSSVPSAAAGSVELPHHFVFSGVTNDATADKTGSGGAFHSSVS